KKKNLEEKIIAYAELQDQKMYQSGISLVGDISNQPDTLLIKEKSKITYHTFVEILGVDTTLSSQKYNEGLQLRDLFLKKNLKATLVPHAPYSLSRDLFQKIGYSVDNPIVCMHYHESQDEIDWANGHYGKMKDFYDFLKISIPTQDIIQRNEWANFFTKNKHFIAVHNVFATKSDIDFLQTFFHRNNIKLFLCICPQANEYIQQHKPPYFLWEKYQDIVCIGTDSLASNTSLNILSEIEMLQRLYPKILLPHLLQAATYNGAKALNMDSLYGSIAIGKSSELIVLQNLENNSLKDTFVQRIENFF
ncbi:MAG: amidohydrolase family protein, partial [Chitinophagaceae bacterium]